MAVENIRSKLYEEAFGGQETSLRFGKLSFDIAEKTRRQTALGREISLGEQAILPLHGMQYGSTSLKAGGKVQESLHGFVGEKSSGFQRGLSSMFVAGDSGRDISFFYDTELPERFAYHRGITPGAAKIPGVPVKQMMQEAFPTLTAEDTTQKALIAAIEASPTAEAKFIRKVAAGLGGSLSQIGPTAQLEAMTYGAAEKMGMSSFKQFLARFGVQGLSDVNYSLFNFNDPHNIDRYMGELNVVPHGIKNSTAGKALHVSGGNKLDAFSSRLRKAYGRDYASSFHSFATDLLNKAGDPHEISFLMTEGNRLFVGLTGRSNYYFPLPLETRGQMKYGAQYATSRPIMKPDGGVVSASREYMNKFIEGFSGFGTKGINVGASLEKGHIFASREAHYLPRSGMKDAVGWKGMKEPATSLGRMSFFSGMYDIMTVRKAAASNVPFHEALYGEKGLVSRRLSRRKDVRGGSEELLRSVHQELTVMKGMGGTIDPYMYPTIKAGFSGVYPLAGMRSFFLPGSFSSRDYTKGVYQVRGRQEVYLPSELSGIKSTRAQLGYAARTTPVGMMSGDIAAGRQLRRVWSRMRGKLTTPVTTFPMLIGSIEGQEGAALAGIFGDSGALRTPTGTSMLARRRPTATLEHSMNAADARRFIGTLSGGATSKEWQKLNRQLMGGQRYVNLGGGLPIAPGAGQEVRKMFGVGLPAGAENLIGAQYQEFTDSIKLSFGTGVTNAASDALLVNNIRMSARSVSASFLQKNFGVLGNAVDIITSGQNLSSANAQERAFFHRTGLLGTKIGQKGGGLEKFMERYAAAGGGGLQSIGENIVPTSAFKYSNFVGASGRALMDMGFSPGQIKGYALGGAGRGAGMLNLLGQPEHTGASAALGKSKIFIGTGAQRAKETADILSQGKSFSVKLESLNLMAQSMVRRFGGVGLKSAWMHPAWALLAGQYEESTKLKLSRNTVSPSMFVKGMPQGLRNLVAPLSPDFEKTISGNKFHGYDVLTREQAYRQFVATEGGINTKMLNKKGISNAEIKRTKLFEAGRKGFFVDVGKDPWLLPDSGIKPEGLKGAERLRASKYVYVPGGDDLSKIMGPGRPARGSLVQSVIGLIEDPVALATERRGSAIHTPAEYFASIWRGIAGLGGKEGMLSESFMASGRTPGAIRARLTQAPKTVSAAKRMTGSALRSSAFNVYVSEETLTHLAKSGAGDVSKLRSMAQQGTLYGAVRPTPTHSSAHLPMVKVRLSEGLSGFGATGEHHVAMNPFTAWQLNRDVDKDVIDLVVREKWPDGTIDPKKVIAEQVRHASSSFEAWKGAQAGYSSAEAAFKSGDLASLSKKALPYFGFGNLPPIAFMGAYSTSAFGSAITEEIPAGQIASHLNKISKGTLLREFVDEDILTYRRMLSKTDPRGMFESAWLLQRNIYQAPITKGGTALRTLLDEFLNIPHTVSEMLARDPGNLDSPISESIGAAKKFLDEMTGNREGRGILSKIHTDLYSEMSPADMRDEIARQLGTLHGTAAVAMHRHYNPGSSTPHMIHGGIGEKKGSLAKLYGFMFGESHADLDSVKGISPDLPISESQQTLDALNTSIRDAGDSPKIGSEVGQKAATFMKNYWKLGVGAGAAVVALRAISSALTDENSIVSPAPLPRQPMVGMPDDNFNPVNLAPPRAYVMPSNGQGFSAHGGNNMNSVDIANAVGEIGVNMGSQAGSFATVNIRDSRQFRSYYDMQRAARARSDSDFTTPYQYI